MKENFDIMKLNTLLKWKKNNSMVVDLEKTKNYAILEELWDLDKELQTPLRQKLSLLWQRDNPK